ncbi:MAG: translocation/assembly module TamB domain-containing protein [Desulfuromonadales bacterium]
MKRVLKIIFVVASSLLAGLILTLLSVLLLIIGTENGTQFAWQRAKAFLPDTVEINAIEGRLAGPLEIRGLKIKDTGFHLELDKVELEWTPSRLLWRVLDVESIALEGLRYTQLETVPPKSKEESTPVKLPEEISLPLDVRLGKVSLRDFEFRSQPDNAPIVIVSAILSVLADKHGVDISSLKIESPLFTVEGRTSLTTDRNYPVKGELQWQVPVPDYPAVSGHTLLSGSLRELIITQSIAKPYDVQGRVLLRNPVENLAFEVELNVNPLQLQALNKDLPPMTVQLAATGKGDPSDIAFNLNGWAEDPGLGRVNAVLDGGLKSKTVTIDALKVSVPGQPARMTASGQIEIADELELDLTIDWQQLQWPLKGNPLIISPRGSVKLTGSPEKLHAGLDVAIGDTGKIEGKAYRENEVVDFTLDWHDLQWPLQQPTVKSSKGHITVGGKINAYSLRMLANVDVPEHSDARLLLEGQGSQEALSLSRIDINMLEGKLEGKANLSWKPELKGNVDLVGRGLNPGAILKDWPGKLNFSLSAQGGIRDDLPSLQLQQVSVQGQLRGYQVALDAAGTYEENLTTLKRLAVSSGSTKLEVSGTVSDMLDVIWQVHSEDLGTLLPNAKGRIHGNGMLAGPVKRPRVAATLTAEGLVYTDYRLNSLNLDADIDLTGKTHSKLSLTIEDGNAAGVELRNISVNGLGNAGAHTLTLAADTASGQADIALQGELENPWQQDMIWNFRLNQATLKYPDLDGWVLQKPSSGQITDGQAMLAESCWQSGEALLCLKGHQSKEKNQADFVLTDLPFSYVSHYLPPDIDLQGSLSGNGTFNQSGQQDPSVNIDLKTSAVRLLSHDLNEEQGKNALIIAFQPGDIHLQMQQGGLQAGMELPLSKTDGLALQATISPGQDSLMKRPLKGQITTEIQNLDFIADLIPEVQAFTGRLTGNMAIAGSLESPVLKGRLALVEGAAKLERPGLNLKDIKVELTGEGDSGIRLTAHAVSEGGELNIDGSSDLRGKDAKADIRVKGENFRVINTFEAQVDASPNLTITLSENRINVGGEVVIPNAQITLKTLPESAVNASDDQVIIKSEEPETASGTTGREMYASVRTILGDNVNFNGFGLKARIQGSILAVEKPGEPTTGSGELKIVDGEYRAYGQGLVIEKGRVLFSGGPINQPGLDVRAVRRPKEGITVGVQVRGNLRQPDFKLFSDPSMTQGNQLSYLVLGRPMSETSGGEGSALSQASLALGLKGGNAVAAKIGGKLGLDQFGVESSEAGADSDPEKASFVVGKYLSPKLYVSYGLGLFDPISTLRVKYALSSHWKLVSNSSSEASGGDVLYTIETGK